MPAVSTRIQAPHSNRVIVAGIIWIQFKTSLSFGKPHGPYASQSLEHKSSRLEWTGGRCAFDGNERSRERVGARENAAIEPELEWGVNTAASTRQSERV